MHYLDEGPGDAPPVLMLHGNPSWSFYYRNLVLALRENHRCIVPDHIGCGLSDKPPLEDYDYCLQSRIDDLSRLMQHLQLDQGNARPITLVVHDWGGMIGMAWAVQHAEHIEKLVIMNTAAFPMPREKRLPAALALARNSRLGAWLVLRCNAFAGAAARVGFKKPVSQQVRDAYVGPYDSPANRIATLRFVQDIPLSEEDSGFDILLNTAEHLGKFSNLPCLVAWGERDFVFDQPFLDTWLKLFPQAQTIRLPDCGHYVLEDGGAELLEHIGQFIAIREDANHGQTVE
ncbi:MAG: alpha/beta fold hydrolase [Xanthomonadales bacterium]|nr:alpha/beta fold hydrolase [Xanthomonadales bacterium]